MEIAKLFRDKKWWIAAAGILALLAVLLNGKVIWYAAQDLTFYWTERTETEIKVKELPEVDDDFASEVSEFETVAEYKESVKAKIAERKEKAAKDAKEDAVIDAIIEAAEMEIPDAMLETQQRQMVEDFAQRIQMQGLSMEQYMQFTGLTVETLLDQVKPQALRRIQSRLVLEAIAVAEKFEVTEAEYDEEISKMAEMYQMEADKVKELLGEKHSAEVRKDITVRKAVEYVVANAKEK